LILNTIKFFFLFISFSLYAQDNIPQNNNFNGVNANSYTLVSQYKRLNYSFTHLLIANWDKRAWEQNFINLRYKLTSSFQFGLSHGQQRGDRSNQDWFKDNLGNWSWKDTTHRVENLSDLVFNYKTLIKSFIFEWRNTYRYNHHFETARLVSRIGLNFYSLQCAIKCNLLLSYEEHVPLNDNEAAESWTYATLLFHLNKNLILGPRVTYFSKRWESTDEFTDTTDRNYKKSDELKMYGVHIINRF